MCGIAGVIGHHETNSSLIEDMTRALAHRGPDSEGFIRAKHASFGVRRLSIVDLKHGDQPIRNEDGTLAIVFNGEIYNYRELRDHLTQRGHRFSTRTDTEVVLHLYEEHGPRCVERLRGMFAFAIVSPHEVYIARDRFGIKPLYLARPSKDVLLFASEIKALLRCPQLSVSIDREMLGDCYVLGHAVGDRTALTGITTVPPGHYLVITTSRSELCVSEHRYFRPQIAHETDVSIDEAVRFVTDALEVSVRRHIPSDVPVGLTLSGGLDSSVLAHLTAQHTRIPTFTVACSARHADFAVARTVAAAIRSDHHDLVPSFGEYLDAIPAYVHAGETVGGLYSLPFFLLCKQVGKAVKVCLNGEGADELFGGYWNYLSPQQTLGSIRRRLSSAERSGIPVSSRAREVCVEIKSVKTFAEYIQRLLSVYQKDQLEHRHLTVLDHYAMASGVEIRVPFLDDDLAEVVNALPVSLKVDHKLAVDKYILRLAALSYGAKALHAPVLRVKKGLPSVGENYLADFEQLCDAAVSDEYVHQHEFRDYFCAQDARGHTKGKGDLLLFDLFYETFITRRGRLSEMPFSDLLNRGQQLGRLGAPVQ